MNDAECKNVQEIPIVCAVTDLQSPDYDVILPIDVVRDLQVAAGASSVSGCVATDVCIVTTETDVPEVKGNAPEDVVSLPTRQVEADSVTLATKREQDPIHAGFRLRQVKAVLWSAKTYCVITIKQTVNLCTSCVVVPSHKGPKWEQLLG